MHKLSDILFIGLCTIISSGSDFEDMVEFGEQRIDWLSELLELPHGIPSHDTFNRAFQLIDPEELKACLSVSGEALLDLVKEKQICIDGKKLKGTSPRSRGNHGLYILNAWVAENRLCIGQQKVQNKSNEITAVPTLLKELDIAGATVSIDAMGCQKEIAALIIDKKADYLLAVKGNQGSLFEEIEDAFRFNKGAIFEEEWVTGHGRTEKRICQTLTAEKHLSHDVHTQWKALNTLVRVEAKRKHEKGEKIELRYYIASDLLQSPRYFNALVRGHWGIENQLHWHLDVTFKEDQSRARTGNTPQNLSILRKVALHKISNMKDKLSLQKRRFRAALNNDYLIKVLDF